RQYTNLLITMLLGGLWHGAGWTFIVWGGLHGVYLIINHSYRSFRKKLGHNLREDHWLLKGVGCLVTFLAVVISWVFFRSNSIPTAFSILSSMLGLNGIQLPGFLEGKLGFLRAFGIGFSGFTVNVGISQQYSTFGIILLLIIVWFTPNTYQWMGRYNPTLNQLEQSPNSESSRIDKFWRKLSWNPGVVWSSIVGIITGISLLGLTHVSEFLYFQF
ncbi:MAG: MBOAT family protein, partial [Sphaerospermopsis kisseleviana]